jgi:hypothetical protein
VEVVDPLILKTGRPARHPISPGHSIAATRSALARSALPRKRVRSLEVFGRRPSVPAELFVNGRHPKTFTSTD